jgi:2'-5' RNA ligase
VKVRAFFAAWPQAAWCRALLAAVPPGSAAGRWLPSADLHVTLRFLGGIGPQQLEAVGAAAARLAWRPFVLRFTGLEWWREAQVLTAAAPLVPAAATELVRGLAMVACEAGIADDPKPFRPHVTLARRVRAAPVLSGLALDLPVTDLCLARSDTRAEGARYTILERWPAPRAS